MVYRMYRRGWPARLAGLAAVGAAAFAVALPASAFGQGRGPGDRTGGGRSESPAPRRDSSPPPPSRDYSPPSRRESSPPPAPSRDYAPPRRDPPPTRDYAPPSRREDVTPAPRRDSSPPRDTTPAPRRDESIPAPRRDPGTRREESRDIPAPRRDETTPAPRRDDPAPKRDVRAAPPVTRDGSSGRGTDRAPRRDDSAERRTRERDIYDPGGPGDIFNRRRPGRGDDTPAAPPAGPSRAESGAKPTGRHPSDDSAPQRDRARDLFTRSAEGRRYENGVVLREGGYITSGRVRYYFPHNYAYYPHYCPTYDYGTVYYSPFSYYYGSCPPYIYRRHCYHSAPAVVYIEIPVYVNDECRGYDNDLDDYYLSRNEYRYDARDLDRNLDRAIDDIREAFRYGNIEPLAQLTDPQARIAVFRRGKYEYSLNASDYLDMTRDALRTTDTIQFDLYRVRRRAAGIYVVSGKHIYRNRDGQRRTVFVIFVLERFSGRWTLTQVGTAPDKIQDW